MDRHPDQADAQLAWVRAELERLIEVRLNRHLTESEDRYLHELFERESELLCGKDPGDQRAQR